MRHKGLFFSTSGFWLAGMVLQKLILAIIAASALDKLVDLQGTQQDYWSVFMPYIIWFIIIGIIAQVCIDIGLWLLSKLETRVRPQLQERLFGLLSQHSLRFHADTFSGALVTQVNRFTTSYVTITDNFVIVILKMVTNVLIAIAIIAFYSPLIAVSMFIWTIIFTSLSIFLTKRRLPLTRRASAAESVVTAHLADAMGNISAVKAFAREDEELQQHREKANDRARKRYISWTRAIRNDVFLGILMTILQLMVLVMSITSVMEGHISIGVMLLIQVYITQLMVELWGLGNLSRTLEQSLSDAEEMTEILDQEVEITDPKRPENARINEGKIDFNEVSFTHNESRDDDSLFSGFDLHIAPGEKIGLVGHSGSGKTTLTRLLLRFSDIDAGSITIDGQDIRNIRQRDLRASIAYVPQEPMLFHRTLAENIAYGKPDATLEEIKDAARKANAADFIDKLPHGYETMVGERGVKLSGGQRQRIAIARAILKDAPILVLDEATSALDSESEGLIQDALRNFMKGRTTIVIAHRLSTIQNMDRIVVLHNGTIVETGSHKQLLARKGAYAELWTHQSGGFLES